jgi:hypothetical protein
MDPPATVNNDSMPRWSSSIACARTMSRIVMTGKSSPHGLPVLGSVDDGPVVPMQAPTTFGQITK